VSEMGARLKQVAHAYLRHNMITLCLG